MRVLATQEFVEAAREAPQPLIQAVTELATRTSSPTSLTQALTEAVGQAAGDAPRAKRIGRGQIIGLTQDSEQLKLWYYVSPTPFDAAPAPPFASMAKSELRALGVPNELIGPVQQVVMVEEIDHLAMTVDVKDRLRFLFLQLTVGLEANDDDLVRKANSTDHLLDFLHGRVTDLLLNLDPSQERVVKLSGSGAILVRGVAGSGKTAVALHRIHHLLSQGDLFKSRRVLLLTYNRSLATAAKELLLSLGGAAVRDVEVHTMHKWAMGFAGIHASRVMISHKERQRKLSEAVDAVKKTAPESALWSYPLAFWQSEIHLIKGRAIPDRESYAGLRRHGAQRPLAPKLRQMVWDVYESYRAVCQRTRRLDWDDIILEAFRRMDAQGESAPRYDFVFLEEAQDLTVSAIQLAAQLARPPGELFIGFDAAQSIYERGFRWKDAGVTVHGARSFAFNKNYRNTRSILDAARPVLADVYKDHASAEGEGEDLLQPEAAIREGTAPRHLPCQRGKEADAIVVEIDRLVRDEHVKPGNIAVLVFRNEVKSAIYFEMKKQGVICQAHGHDSEIRLADPSVKVLPMKSAKGLEFPVVFLVASGWHFQPPSKKMDEHDVATYSSEMRRLFYVAMTRAMSDLILVYPPEDPPPFFTKPAPPQDEQVRLEDLYLKAKKSWGAVLRSLDLPVDAGITKYMTLAEAREFVRRRSVKTSDGGTSAANEPGGEKTIGQLYQERRGSWRRLLEELGLPEGIGITKNMTLAEARKLAAKASNPAQQQVTRGGDQNAGPGPATPQETSQAAKYRDKVRKYLEDDGEIDAKERDLLQDLRAAWGIDEQEAARIEQEVRASMGGSDGGAKAAPVAAPAPAPASVPASAPVPAPMPERAVEAPVVAQGNTKFHRPDCQWLRPGINKRTFKDRQEAVDAGLVPCGTCKP